MVKALKHLLIGCSIFILSACVNVVNNSTAYSGANCGVDLTSLPNPPEFPSINESLVDDDGYMISLLADSLTEHREYVKTVESLRSHCVR